MTRSARVLMPCLIALSAAGCGAATSPPCKSDARAAGSAAVPTASGSAAASPDDAPPELLLTIHPSPAPAPRVRIRATLRGSSGVDASRWSMAASAHAALDGAVTFEDERGAIEAAWKDEGARSRATLGRAPSGDLSVAWTVAGVTPAYPTPEAAMVDPDRFDAPGEALLLLPDAMEDKSVPASIEIETPEIGSKEFVRAASSFGFGKVRTTVASGRALRSANFVAALMGKAIFEAPEGRDEAVWMGYTAFDPRPASADMAGFRTAVKEMFKPSDGTLATVLFLADPRPTGSFVVARRTHGVVLRIGPGETWSGPVRIAAAAALLHEWIGDRLWIGPTDEGHAGEAYWFSEGVVRGLARDLLFRFGLLTPGESASEVEALASLTATSPLLHGEGAKTDNASLGARVAEAGVTPILVARGALYAARIDALIRSKSGGKRALIHVVTELYAKAAKAQAALPTSAWVEAIRAELGDAEADAFDAMIGQGKTIDVPDGALGPCFQRAPRSFVAFSLGFDKEATKRAEGRRITGLDPKGPAASAGVKEGDELVSVDVTDGRADTPVKLVVRRADKEVTFQFLPEGGKGKGFGWNRKRDVPEEKCAG
ncbi:MAG: hypothetical protein U0414_05995 [Polyangiaceae bacterium]